MTENFVIIKKENALVSQSNLNCFFGDDALSYQDSQKQLIFCSSSYSTLQQLNVSHQVTATSFKGCYYDARVANLALNHQVDKKSNYYFVGQINQFPLGKQTVNAVTDSL